MTNRTSQVMQQVVGKTVEKAKTIGVSKAVERAKNLVKGLKPKKSIHSFTCQAKDSDELAEFQLDQEICSLEANQPTEPAVDRSSKRQGIYLATDPRVPALLQAISDAQEQQQEIGIAL